MSAALENVTAEELDHLSLYLDFFRDTLPRDEKANTWRSAPATAISS